MKKEKRENKVIRILFVCHGNICRSPMAECIFKDLVRKDHREGQFYIASAATSGEEIWNGRGNPVYPPARAELKKHGLSLEGKRAVQMTREDYQRYDYLIGMDHENLYGMKRICGGDPEGKIHRILDFSEHPRDIADPWYTGDFVTAYRDIEEGCLALYRHLTKTRNKFY